MKKRLLFLGLSLLGTTGAVFASANPSTTEVKAEVQDFNDFYGDFFLEHEQDHILNITADGNYQLTADLTLSHIVNIVDNDFVLDLNGYTLSLTYCYKASGKLTSVDDYGGFALNGDGSIKVYDSNTDAGTIIAIASSKTGSVYGYRSKVPNRTAGRIFTTGTTSSTTPTKYGSIDVENINFYMDYQVDGSAGSPIKATPTSCNDYYDEARLLDLDIPADVTFKNVTYSAKFSPIIYGQDMNFDVNSSSNYQGTYLFENCTFSTGYITGLCFRGNSSVKFKNSDLTCSYEFGSLQNCSGDYPYNEGDSNYFVAQGTQPVYGTMVYINQNASVEFESCNIHDSNRFLYMRFTDQTKPEFITSTIKFSGTTQFNDIDYVFYGDNIDISHMAASYFHIDRTFIDETENSNYLFDIEDTDEYWVCKENEYMRFLKGDNEDLQKIKINSEYKKISCETIEGQWFIGPRVYTKQPTTLSPSVGTSFEGQATYQWYKAAKGSIEQTPTTDGVSTAYSDATYDTNVNKWKISTPSAYGYYDAKTDFILFSMPVKKGEKIIFRFYPNEYFDYNMYYLSIVLDLTETTIYVDDAIEEVSYPQEYYDIEYVFTTDETYYFYLNSVEFKSSEWEDEYKAADLYFQVFKEGYVLGDPVIGETNKELTTTQKGMYVCVTTWNAGQPDEYSMQSNVLNHDLVQAFIETYMHMNDYTESNGYCADETHHYYATAKEAYDALPSELKESFNVDEDYEAALNRFKAWAAANGDQLNADYEVVPMGLISIENISSNTGILIRALILTISAAAVLIVISLRKKELTKS